MKICTICNQTYTSDDINYCLADGGLLTNMTDDPPPTMMMNQARKTNEINFGNPPDTNWSNQPNQSNQSNWANQPPPGPISPWQNQQTPQNQGYMPPMAFVGQNQTLPTVSMILGILSILLICCYGGFYFGIPAAVIGYIGMTNANNNPNEYGGRGMAIAGMITGGITALLAIGWILFIIFASLVK